MFRVGLDLGPAERGLGAFRSRLGSVFSGVGTAAVAGLTALGTATALFGSAVIEAGTEMEGFETRLTTLMGSSSAAQARMEELFAFAATTPFELAQVVGAETTLRGFGAAAEELMPGLIDFAAVTGTDMTQAAIDFGKAWSVGAVGLESDGGKILRKQIEIATGMDAAAMSIEDFRAAMLETLDTGIFAGGADRLSKTMGGMISNLKDEWSRFKLEVADAGLFNNVKAGLGEVLTLIGDNREELAEVASLLSGGIWLGIKGAGIGLAVMADSVGAIGRGMLIAELALADFGSRASDLMGADGASAYMTERAAMLRDLLAQQAEIGAVTEETVAFFAKVEKAAAEMGAESSAALGKVGGSAGGLGDGESDMGKGFMGDLDAELARAQSFLADVAILQETDIGREMRLHEERLTQLQAFYDAGLLLEAQYGDAGEQIQADYAATVEAYWDDLAIKRQEQREKDIAAEKAARQTELEIWRAQADGIGTIFGTIGDMMEQANGESTAASKIFAHAQIAINAAIGSSRAWADYGWPYALIPQAAIAVQAVAAHVNVEKAHQGGVVYADSSRMPDERDRGGKRTLTQEVVLNSQVTRALSDAMNSGTGGGSTSIDLHVGREVQHEIIRTDMRSGGQIPAAIDRSRRGNRDSGWSGARSFA